MFNGGVEWVKGVSVFPFSPFLYFSLRFPRGLTIVGIFSLCIYLSLHTYQVLSQHRAQQQRREWKRFHSIFFFTSFRKNGTRKDNLALPPYFDRIN